MCLACCACCVCCACISSHLTQVTHRASRAVDVTPCPHTRDVDVGLRSLLLTTAGNHSGNGTTGNVMHDVLSCMSPPPQCITLGPVSHQKSLRRIHTIKLPWDATNITTKEVSDQQNHHHHCRVSSTRYFHRLLQHTRMISTWYVYVHVCIEEEHQH